MSYCLDMFFEYGRSRFFFFPGTFFFSKNGLRCPTITKGSMVLIYIYIWVNYNDLTAISLGIMVNKGNHPQMAELFRLVKYYNLPRYIYIYLLDPFPQNISETMGVFFPISEFPIWLVPVGSRQRKQLRACARGLAAGPGRCRSYFFGEGNCRFWQTEILKHVAYTVA